MYHMITAMFKEKSKDDIKEKYKLLIVVSLDNEYMVIIFSLPLYTFVHFPNITRVGEK